MGKKNKFKIIHGPVNICGIGRRLADWQRKQGAISDFVVFTENPLIPNSHFNLDVNKYNFFVQKLIFCLFFFMCLLKYKIFHFYFGKSLLRYNLDLPILRLFGKKIVMTYCGSDIRLIEVEKKRNPYWRLISSSQDGLQYDSGKRMMMKWQKLWVHRVIAPRNLYGHACKIFPEKMIISDLWIHNLLDLVSDETIPFNNNVNSTVPLLVHAPSHQGLKGTKYVEKAIQELEQEGYEFEYRRVENVTNLEAHKIYRDKADIILDQFILGNFGTLAVEGMFYGKPVVSYLIEEVKQKHYPDVPIINATIDNLKEKLKWLILHPEERTKIGLKGRAYVERHFDYEKINMKLWDIYKEL